MKVSEILTKALEFFGPNGERWQRCAMDNSKCCALQAIVRAARNDFNMGTDITQKGFYIKAGSPEHKAAEFIKQAVDSQSVMGWNDHPKRIWPEVKIAFDTAIIYAQIQEGK